MQGSSEQTWLSAHWSWSRELSQAPASKVLSDDKERQGSDEEDSSSSDEDGSGDKEKLYGRLLRTSLFLLICLRLVKLPKEEMSRNAGKAGGGGLALDPTLSTRFFQLAKFSVFFMRKNDKTRMTQL